MSKSNTFCCAACGGVYEKAWTDQDAAEEFDAVFPDEEIENAEVVCDDCFRAMMAADVS